MIEAWFSASEMMASSAPSSGSKRPPLASKQAAKRMESSLPSQLGDALLELAVQRLRAADEAHRGHAEAELVERVAGRGDDLGVVGKAEIVVGAEVDHLALAALRARDRRCGYAPIAARRSAARACKGPRRRSPRAFRRDGRGRDVPRSAPCGFRRDPKRRIRLRKTLPGISTCETAGGSAFAEIGRRGDSGKRAVRPVVVVEVSESIEDGVEASTRRRMGTGVTTPRSTRLWMMRPTAAPEAAKPSALTSGPSLARPTWGNRA